MQGIYHTSKSYNIGDVVVSADRTIYTCLDNITSSDRVVTSVYKDNNAINMYHPTDGTLYSNHCLKLGIYRESSGDYRNYYPVQINNISALSQ